MAQYEYEDVLENLIKGGVSGLQEGINTRKEIYKTILGEQIKQKMKQEFENKQMENLLNKFGGTRKAKYSISPSGLTATPMTSKELLEEQEAEEILGMKRDGTSTITGQKPTTQELSKLGKPLLQPKVEKSDLIPTEFDKYGRPTKYKSLGTEIEELTRKKKAEFDVKKNQLKKDLDSFFAVDDLIDRAEDGFLKTRQAGIVSKWRALSQEGIKGYAARTHDATTKRLRVQLVRAAGDVGNINIVEQQAAEQMVPGFFDSKGSAEIKRAFLKEVTKAIDDNSPNGVKVAIQKFIQSEAYKKPENIQTSKTFIPKSDNTSEMTLGQLGQEVGGRLKRTFEPFTRFPSVISGTAGYESMSNVADQIQEFAKPILQGKPEGIVNNFVADMVTHPATYIGLFNLMDIKRVAAQETKQILPRIMNDTWIREKSTNIQKVGQAVNKIKNAIYKDIYSTVGEVPTTKDIMVLIKQSDVDDVIMKQIQKTVGKKIITVQQAKDAFDIINSKTPQSVFKGKTLGRGGLAYKGLQNKKLSAIVKDIIYDSVSKVDEGTAKAIESTDSYISKNIYPLLDKIFTRVGRFGEPAGGLTSTFSGAPARAGERLMLKEAPQKISGLKQYLTSGIKDDLTTLSKNTEQVVKDWYKYQARQKVKGIASPRYWMQRALIR